MKFHIDLDNKTVAIEGTVKMATVFSYLMSWFSETWEEWSFVPYTPSIEYKEIVVTKDVYRNPYWNPFNPIIYANRGNDTGAPLINANYTTSGKTTINLIQD